MSVRGVGTEWGSDRSIGSSCRTGSLAGSQNGEGEKEMSNLDAVVEGALDGKAAMEVLDTIVEKIGAIDLEKTESEADWVWGGDG